MKTIRLGIIGVCRRGCLADMAHNPSNGIEVVAGADISEEQINTFKKRYRDKFDTNVNGYLDYKNMLAKEALDGVFITSPDYCHEEQAVTSLEAGVAVYLEKPMAISIEGCDRVLKTAYDHKSKLFLGHNMRHFQVMQKMKEIISSGAVGAVQAAWCRHFIAYGADAYFKDWHSEQKYCNGLLVHKGAHDIDVLHWITGSYTSRVIGMGMLSVYDKCQRLKPGEKPDPSWNIENWPPKTQTNMSPVIDVEDHNMIMMQMENGIQASYMQCHYTPTSERNYTFIGTEGRIENFGDSREAEIHVWNKRKAGNGKSDIIYRFEAREGTHGGADRDIVDNFCSFLKGESAPPISPVAARNAVAVGVKGHESMRNLNTAEVIPPVAEDLYKYFEEGQQ